MAGYSYFDYDQMTLLGIEVHSDELELLQQAADAYDWEVIETEVEPKFREAALDFCDQGTLLYLLARMSWMKICRRVFPFWMRWRKPKW